jgi:lipopolysaccharide export system protein LptA
MKPLCQNPWSGRSRLLPFAASALIFLCCLFSTTLSFSADKSSNPLKQKSLKTDSPLHVASDRMEVSQTDKTILFEGHVVVQQDDLTMTGNRLKVFGVAEKKGTDTAMVDQIDRIEVEGDVRVTQRDRAATAEKAVYYHQQQKIILMGNPTVSQGQDKVQGRLITLFISDGKSIVEGGEATPVQATLHPRKDQ